MLCTVLNDGTVRRKVCTSRAGVSVGRSNEQRYKIGGDVDVRSFWLASTVSPLALEMPYVCTEAGTLYGGATFLTERASKDSYLLTYTFGGAGTFTQRNRTIRVGHGQALLLDCRMPQAYGTASDADHWHHLWAHIEGVGVDGTARRLGLPRLVPIALSSSRMRPHFETLFEHIKAEEVESIERIGLAVHALLSELLMAKARADLPDDNPVSLACAYVATHFGEPLTVEDLARSAHVSASYLTRLFRQQLGTSPHDYLLRYRITQAKQLLIETDIPIGTIARQVGFKTESNFSFRFSKVCDTTPRAYRNLRYGPLS